MFKKMFRNSKKLINLNFLNEYNLTCGGTAFLFLRSFTLDVLLSPVDKSSHSSYDLDLFVKGRFEVGDNCSEVA